jgi:hypothetical protein
VLSTDDGRRQFAIMMNEYFATPEVNEAFRAGVHGARHGAAGRRSRGCGFDQRLPARGTLWLTSSQQADPGAKRSLAGANFGACPCYGGLRRTLPSR